MIKNNITYLDEYFNKNTNEDAATAYNELKPILFEWIKQNKPNYIYVYFLNENEK